MCPRFLAELHSVNDSFYLPLVRLVLLISLLRSLDAVLLFIHEQYITFYVKQNPPKMPRPFFPLLKNAC